MLFLAFSAGFPFAYEARGYSLTICFAAIAFFAWQSATQSADRRSVSLVALTLGIAACAWTHYYGVLLFVPFTVGEIVRLWQRRRVDWAVAIALAAAGLTVIPLWLFVKSSNVGFATRFWATADTPLDAVVAYRTMLAPLAIPFGALLLAGLAWNLIPSAERKTPGHAPVAVPAHEVAAAVCFAALPAVMWFLARFVTNAYYWRYAVFSVAGTAVALAWAVVGPTHGGNGRRALVLWVLLAWTPVHLAMEYRDIEPVQKTRALLDFARSVRDAYGVEVVFDSPLEYLRARHLASASERQHMYHLIDFDAQVRHNDDDTIARALTQAQRYVDLNAIETKVFLGAHRRFAVISSAGFRAGWILPHLLEANAEIALGSERKPFMAFLVSMR
jgi:hypothetical protein